MAMALLRHRVTHINGDAISVEVDSAGYYDWEPFPREAHPFARRAVEGICGYDLLGNHRAKQWTPELVRHADLIVVAEQWMSVDFPWNRVLTIRALRGERGDVADPYGKDYSAYVACAEEIDASIVSGMPELMDRLRVADTDTIQ